MGDAVDPVHEYRNPYRVAALFSRKRLERSDLIEVLGTWPYGRPDQDQEDQDHGMTMVPGTFAAVRWALRDGLLDLALYQEVAARAAAEYGIRTGVASVAELSAADRGVWIISTHYSVYRINLDVMSVNRLVGYPHDVVLRELFRLRSIDRCRVQEPGQWTMHALSVTRDWSVQHTALIDSIVRDTTT